MNQIRVPVTDRLLFFDMVRNVAMLSVILYHAVAAYSTATPHWSMHDGSSAIADGIRHLFDVFMMPAFFFVAGYFAGHSLQGQGAWRFLAAKARRIGIPWLVAIFIIIPLVRYMAVAKAASPTPFWRYWFGYLSSIGTWQAGVLKADRMNQMHFWFLSLLLAFFIGYAVIYRLGNGPARAEGGRTSRPATQGRVLTSLLFAAIVTSLGYFFVSLVSPDMSWATVDLLLQFQPASLVTYAACFALGCFAYSRRWFSGDQFPGRLSVWLPAVLLLTVCFFVVGQSVFAHPLTSHTLSPTLLLAFAFTRTFLCLAILVLLIAYGRRYWSMPSTVNQKFAHNSYNIYLVHLFFIITFQEIMMVWQRGPAMAKASVVFLAVLPFSYGVSRLIDRFPRAFVVGFILLFFVVILATR